MLLNKINKLKLLSDLYQKQWMRLLLALFTGAIGVLAFSPYDYWPLAFISLGGLQLFTLNRTTLQSAAIGFTWGLGLFIVGLNWIYYCLIHFTSFYIFASIFLYSLAAGYLSIYPSLFAAVLNYFCPNPTICRLTLYSPILWHCTEFIRGRILTGFPWLQFGYTQIDGPLRGLAPIAGVDMITFIMMLLIGLLIYAFLKSHIQSLIIFIMSVSIIWSLHYIEWYSTIPNKNIKIGMVQGNTAIPEESRIKQYLKELNIYMTASTPLFGKVPIIIWPESAIGDFGKKQQSLLYNINKKIAKLGSKVITGITDNRLYHNKYYIYNSVIVLNNDKLNNDDTINYYQKNHLVIFGETIPFSNYYLNKILAYFNLLITPLMSRGPYIQSPIKVSGYHFTTAICYESILGEQIRKNFTNNTDFLLIVSNDAWFGNSSEPWQHFQMTRMRALELGRFLIVDTDNGITAIITPKGKIQSILPQFQRKVLIGQITSTRGETPYCKLGQWPIFIIILCTTVCVFIKNVKQVWSEYT